MKKPAVLARHVGRLLLHDPLMKVLRALEWRLANGLASADDADTARALVHQLDLLSVRARRWAERLGRLQG